LAVALLCSCAGQRPTTTPFTQSGITGTTITPGDAVPGWRDAGRDGPQPDDATRAEMRGLLPALASRGVARRAARERLLSLGPEVVPLLIALLDRPNMATRWEAVNALGTLQDQRAISPLLERCLSDRNPHPRWRALWALAAVDQDGSGYTLAFDRLQSGELDEFQRWNAAVLLGARRDGRVVSLLHNGITHADRQRRWEAVYILGTTHDETSSGRLLPLLDDLDPRVRRQTVLTLGKIKDEIAIAALLDQLSDPDPSLRWRAAMGLAGAVAPDLVARLESRLRIETDDRVREYLGRALGIDSR